MVTVGESIFLILIPILFALIGLCFLYYTACLFFNKSWIDIEDGYLKISHRPIPWWRGNKSFEIEQIKQVYVKQKVSKSKKSGIAFYYHLRAKLNNGVDVLLFDLDETESEKAKILENKIEEYIGIEDELVKGEYLTATKILQTKNKIISRETRRDNFSSLFVGDQIKIINRDFNVIHKSQFDWNNGNSDWQFQIIAKAKKAQSLVIEQNKGLFEYYIQDELNILISKEFNFSAEQPPSIIIYKNEQFQLIKTAEGNQFRSDLSETILSKKWSYKSKTGKVVSIIKDKGMITYSAGIPLDKASIVLVKNGLELKPIREKLRSDWKSDDLV